MDLPKATHFIKLVDGNTIPVSPEVYNIVTTTLDNKENEWVEFNSYAMKERFRVRVDYVVLMFTINSLML